MTIKGFVVLVMAILFILVTTFYFVTFSARMEANTFNRFSKTQITWWDALWADYRILPDK